MNTDLVSYYKTRAPEYDLVYTKPERQEALKEAALILRDIFTGKEVLEIACGTGYWTEIISETAKSVLATDINDSMLEIAKRRNRKRQNVTFRIGDLYALSNEVKYQTLFGGFIWSHIKWEDHIKFVSTCWDYVQQGGSLVFIDNNYVEGSNHLITHKDEQGNTYQTRVLNNSPYLVLKNFPDEDSLTPLFAGFQTPNLRFISLQYYWIIVVQKP